MTWLNARIYMHFNRDLFARHSGGQRTLSGPQKSNFCRARIPVQILQADRLDYPLCPRGF